MRPFIIGFVGEWNDFRSFSIGRCLSRNFQSVRSTTSLAESLRSPYETERQAAVELADTFPDEELLPQLLQAVSDPAELVRDLVPLAIASIGTKSAKAALDRMDKSEWDEITHRAVQTRLGRISK